MSLTSFFASKCFEYLLKEETSTVQQKTMPLYPPWSVAGKDFRALCDGCGKCVAACGNRIIVIGEDSFPVIDFTQGCCTFCGDCARSCPTEALQFDADKAPWHLRVRIAASCLLRSRMLCFSCVEQCEQGAIRLPQIEGQLPERIATQCNGCGACARSCPVGAISFTPSTDGE
jgi:ferredoxin-type protein NapF